MKNLFIKSTLILLIGGMFTKLIGFFIKIYYTRLIGIEGIGLLSIVMPTYSLLLSIANFNIQTSISKRISSGNNSSKTIVNAFYIMITIDVLLISFILLFGKYISIYLLKNKYTYIPIVVSCLSLPFISIGYIVKGYFYGKQNVLPHMISNVLEQLFRMLIIFIFLPKVLKYGTIISVSVLLGFNIFSELFSVAILYLFLPKKISINKNIFKTDRLEINSLLNISGPTVLGRLICNIGYFFEPIIFTNLLLYKGFSISNINNQYGIYHMYAISLLLFPSFFINAISNSLLPEISKFYSKNDYNSIKRRIYQSSFISLCLGLILCSFIFIFRDFLLNMLYGNTLGSNYVKYICFFFILFYLEGPLSSILIGINKVKTCTLISIFGMIIKLMVLVISIILGFNYYSLLISEVCNVIFVVLMEIISIKNSFIFNDV